MTKKERGNAGRPRKYPTGLTWIRVYLDGAMNKKIREYAQQQRITLTKTIQTAIAHWMEDIETGKKRTERGNYPKFRKFVISRAYINSALGENKAVLTRKDLQSCVTRAGSQDRLITLARYLLRLKEDRMIDLPVSTINEVKIYLKTHNTYLIKNIKTEEVLKRERKMMQKRNTIR